MSKVIYRGNDRGFANHGWLQSYHTFSFANYYNPDKIHFGALRVFNDDSVKGGMGFGTHPHDNMEIVSIPISGALQHRDSSGRNAIINTNDVQIMSAGSGIAHSEMNASKTETVDFLQIWVIPEQRNITPRYEQKTFDPAARRNKLQVVVSPEKDSEGLWINQQAWFSLGDFDAGQTLDVTTKFKGAGSYIFLFEGEATVDGETLQTRDAIGISAFESAEIRFTKPSSVLIIDVPMLN